MQHMILHISFPHVLIHEPLQQLLDLSLNKLLDAAKLAELEIYQTKHVCVQDSGLQLLRFWVLHILEREVLSQLFACYQFMDELMEQLGLLLAREDQVLDLRVDGFDSREEGLCALLLVLREVLFVFVGHLC